MKQRVSQDCGGYVSRGGVKLAAALEKFGVSPAGLVCADFGSHAGGFVDCLLNHGARRVFAVDTGYGVLDWKLRRDPRVAVRERTNAMEFLADEPCELITIDAGWTPQRLILPSARRNLARTPAARVITLLKPQYEAPKEWLRGGVLPDEKIEPVLAGARRDITALGWETLDAMLSPIRGHAGNSEYLLLLRLVPAAA